MAILSTESRTLIDLKSLNSATISNQDVFLVEDVSETISKNISVGDLKTTILSELSSYSSIIVLTNTSNKITGSIYSPVNSYSSFYNSIIRNNLSVTGNTTIAGNLSVTGTTTIDGVSLASDFSGNMTGSVNGTVTGALTGSSSGSVTANVYNTSGTLIVDNGDSGNNPTFYGTSSYSLKTDTNVTTADSSSYLIYSGGNNGTASFAISCSSQPPAGGAEGYALIKNSNNDYDFTYTQLPTKSGVIVNRLAYWNTSNNLTVAPNAGYNTSNSQYTFINANITNLTASTSLNVKKVQRVEGLYDTNSDGTDILIDSINESFAELRLSASCTVTMSLKAGQKCNLLVSNQASYNVTEWSGSTDGSSANIDIMWNGGVAPTITVSAAEYSGRDLIEFFNINGQIIGNYTQDFRRLGAI